MIDAMSQLAFVLFFTLAVCTLGWLLTDRFRRQDERLERIASLRKSQGKPARTPWRERLESRVQQEIEDAGVNWTTETYLQRMALGVVAGIAMPLLLFGSAPLQVRLVGAIAGAYAGFRSPRWWLDRAKRERQTRLHSQLPEILASLAASTHAGVSWIAAFQQGAADLPYPANEEFLRTYQAIQYGASIDDALSDLQRRVGSEDFDFVISAVRLQVSMGGSLKSVFATASRIIRERVIIHQEVTTKMAPVRSNSIIGTVVPLGLLGMMRLTAPEMTDILFTTLPGQIGCAVGIGFWALGQWIIRRMSHVRY